LSTEVDDSRKRIGWTGTMEFISPYPKGYGLLAVKMTITTTKCLVSITVPGTVFDVENHPLIDKLKNDLDKVGIEYNLVDTVLGWSCPNQNWLEFKCDMGISRNFPAFFCFHKQLSTIYCELLHHGLIIMILHRINEGKLIPNH